MNAPEEVVSAKATRRVPGVKVPVAAPNWALELTSRASWVRVRPLTAGNVPVAGCSAAGSSLIAGGGPGVVAGFDAGACVVVVVAVLELWLWLAPQPARRAIRPSADSVRSWGIGQ